VNIRELVLSIADSLGGYSDTPRLDSEVLVAFVLGMERIRLITESMTEVTPETVSNCLSLAERRKSGEPVAYLVGEKEFFGHSFCVSSAVLVPRPETEHLVEAALVHLKSIEGASKENTTRVLELGIGSGAISISLAKESKWTTFIATDISEDAIGIAEQNAKKHSVELDIRKGSWFEKVKEEAPFNLIVTNPPYVPLIEKQKLSSIAFEPEVALFSGEDGLDSIREILSELDSYLAPGGLFLCEFGFGQSERLSSLAKELVPFAHKIEIINDLAGIPRILSISREDLAQ
jgi:release factor glutamine methyltransferase